VFRSARLGIDVLTMNEARLSHLPFWGPSEGLFSYKFNGRRVNPNETFEFWVKGSGKPLA